MASINQHGRQPRSSRIGTNKYGPADEFLARLSLYNTDKWGTALLLRYGHDRHVRKHRQGRQLPSYYIPRTEWWQHHARCIRLLAYGDNQSTTALRRLDPFPAIVEAMNHHMSKGIMPILMGVKSLKAHSQHLAMPDPSYIVPLQSSWFLMVWTSIPPQWQSTSEIWLKLAWMLLSHTSHLPVA